MKLLLVTEKCNPIKSQRDGGARLVETIQRKFTCPVTVLQFGQSEDSSAAWQFDYPFVINDRFQRRIANANFIAEKVKVLEGEFTHVAFIHLSMQFGLVDIPLHEKIVIWTFPMLLTPSYVASGEVVPPRYFEMERQTLALSKNIVTPSHLEKRQLMECYSVPEKHIHVIPRGVDTQWIVPKVRSLDSHPKFCAVGSIKPQKNTIGLIGLFEKVRVLFPGSTLRIIGPIQNLNYHDDLLEEIKRLGVDAAVELCGYIPPNEIPSAIEDTHLHLSTSRCETFGRSIFETLALGLPNVARASGNAAAEFLQGLPYARFSDNDADTLEAIQDILMNLPTLSAMASEIGELYDDKWLSQLLSAEICNKDSIGICDFDGTLYHKDDPHRTKRCMDAFQNYPNKVLCSARSIDDLLKKINDYQLEVDWIVGCSGSVVTNGKGEVLWYTPLDVAHQCHIKNLVPHATPVEIDGNILQMTLPAHLLPNLSGLRIEVYQEMAFIGHWEASKLHAVHRLLRHINWTGRVSAFGDGPYDAQLLTFFDGTFLSNNLKNEVVYV